MFCQMDAYSLPVKIMWFFTFALLVIKLRCVFLRTAAHKCVRPGLQTVCLLDAADVFLLLHTSCQQRKCVFCVSQFKRRTFALLKEEKKKRLHIVQS